MGKLTGKGGTLPDQAPAKGDKEGDASAGLKEAFDTCYNKCVAQETKDVAEERLKVRV